jgi:hypothetical protein
MHMQIGQLRNAGRMQAVAERTFETSPTPLPSLLNLPCGQGSMHRATDTWGSAQLSGVMDCVVVCMRHGSEPKGRLTCSWADDLTSTTRKVPLLQRQGFSVPTDSHISVSFAHHEPTLHDMVLHGCSRPWRSIRHNR